MTSFLRKAILLAVGFWLASFAVFAQQAPALGTFYDFNVVGFQRVKNSGNTIISASVAVAEGNLTGPSPTVLRETHVRNQEARKAHQDATAAFNAAAAQPKTNVLKNLSLGGTTLTPGVYELNGNTQLTGELLLDGENNPNAVFIFHIKGDFNIANFAQISLRRDARSAQVYWVVEQKITTGISASLVGNFLARQNISLGDGTRLLGRVATLAGEVDLTNNRLSIPADLGISIQKTPGANGINRYIVGETITYTLTAKNNGPVDETDVKVMDIHFTGDNPTHSSTAPGSTFVRNATTGMWVWNIGRLNYGQEVTLTITAKINLTGNGFVRAVISGAGVDEIRANNTAELNFCVVLPNAGNISGPNSLCVNTDGTYSIEPVPGAYYAWNVPSSWEIVSGQGTTSIKVKAGQTSGVVSVTVNNTCGESLPSRLEVSNFSNMPQTPGPITGTEGVCAGASVTYSIANVANASSYNWTVPNGWTISSGQGTTQITVLAGTAAGNVTVRVVNGCGTSDPSSLEVKPSQAKPAMPGPITGESSVCTSVTSKTYSIPAQSDATSYRWTVPAGWTLLSGQGTTTITVKPTSSATAGAVSVVAVNACGDSPARTYQVVPVAGAPALPGAITGASGVCAGNTGLKYAVAPVAGATGYTWTVPAGWTITAGQNTPEITVSVAAGASGGKVTVLASNVCGSSGTRSLDVVFTAGAPVAPVAIRGTAYGCANSTATYEIDPVAGAKTYTWVVPEGWILIGGQGTTRITVRVGDSGGNVSVTASNDCGGGTRSLGVTPFTSVPTKPIAIKGDMEICESQQNIVYSIDAVANTLVYVWTVPTGWKIVSGQGSTSITVTPGAASGNVAVTASNDCGTSAAATLAVTPESASPVAKLGDITGEALFCSGSSQTYSIQAVSGASTYNWTFPGSDWVILSGQGTTTVTVRAGSTAGKVTVTATNACGNSSNSTALTVAATNGVPPVPAEIINDNGVFCEKAGNLTFRIAGTSSTGVTYTWSVPDGWAIVSGQGTTQITVKAGTAAGEVVVYASNICGKSASKKLYVAPLPSLPALGAIQGPSLPCSGKAEETYTVPAIAGATTYLWTVPSGWEILAGAGSNTIKVRVAGDGKVAVKAQNQCGLTNEVSLAVKVTDAEPTAPVSITGEKSLCADRTATYSTNPTANASSYEWAVPNGWTITSGQGTAKITVSAGTASGNVTVKAVNGCSSSEAATLAVSTAPNPSVGRITERGIACAAELVYEIEPVNGATNYTWTLPNGWAIIYGQGTTSITVTRGSVNGQISVVADNDVCQSEPATYMPGQGQLDSGLIFPNVFTPNNDGNNDTWEVTNLLNYPENDLVIINRWGNEVFKTKSYKNNWSGDNLAEGTYYYVSRVKLCDGTEQVFKGYVMIVR